MYDVVHRCMSMVASLALSTAKAMCCQGVDFGPTVTAGVGTKKGLDHLYLHDCIIINRST